MNTRLAYIIPLLFLVLPVAAQEKLTGYVIDDVTGDSLGFTTIQYKGEKVMTMADHRGYFTIPKLVGKKLTFSAVGYKTKTITIKPTSHRLLESLKPDTKSLGEVTVRSKRGKYSRKNNPAVELMRKVIAAKKRTDLSNRDYYQYTKYQKLTLALNDMKPDMLTNPKLAKYPWLTDQVEKCQQTGKLILPASIDETVTQKIYRRDPHKEKSIIKGQRTAGLTTLFETGDVLNVLAKDVFTDVNIYDDQVRVLQHPFTSPIGSGAISFYRYYIEDTVAVDNSHVVNGQLVQRQDSCIHLHFLPNNQQDFGFRGDIYILKDSSYQVKRCEIILPNQTDVNFVESLRIIQEFTPLETGEWVLTTDDMIVELVLFDFLQKGVAIRTTRLDQYSFDPIPDKLFRGRVSIIADPDASMQDEAYWAKARPVELTRSEARMDDFLKGMKTMGGFSYLLAAIKVLSENFLETAQKSKVDIGPISSMVSSNFIDGLRLRVGAQTTANLSPHLFWKGYVARGMRSKNTYYDAEMTWTLNRKRYSTEEFPKRSLTLQSTYDVMKPSDKFMTLDKDNIFTSLRWTSADKMMFYNRQQLTFEYETDWNLLSKFSLKAEENEAAGHLEYFKLRTTELRASFEYSPGALYSNSKQSRVKINREAPIFTLSHAYGVKGFLGSDIDYHYSEASIYKRFWLSSWGRIDMFTRAGVQWSQVPYPLLCMPAANLSIISHKQMFHLITNMEFLNDRFWSVDLNWDMQGKILNRIPLIKKARLREYIGVKMLWGALSDKNNPLLAENAGNSRLLPFPDGSRIMNPKVPYWEISVGVRGILRFFQVEYVRRMNYNSPRLSPKNGIRLGVTMMF